jgi:hypothetical protein
MHRSRLVFAVLAAGLVAGTVVFAQKTNNSALTVAVYGDSPYGTTPTDTSETDLTPAFINSINADPDVSLVLHVGDIHSGKQYCTQTYDQTIYNLWLAFQDPLIYTPGDNEWTDCHKSGEGGHVYLDPPTNSMPVDYADGDPLANLALIRSIFFVNPGYSLGQNTRQVLTQAQNYDATLYPTDGNYVENVMWEENDVLFVTINVPGGSNNDSDPWYGAPITTAQSDEIEQRRGADLHWLDFAFTTAANHGDRAIVIETQADMWDRDGKALSHLANYEPVIASIASHTLAFARPVLLFNGDSHHYRSDNPLKPGQPCVFENGTDTGTVACNSIPDSSTFTQDAWNNHPSYDVPNFHRIVVHGSTTPLEWLRLIITSRASFPRSQNAFGPFSWERIQPQLP